MRQPEGSNHVLVFDETAYRRGNPGRPIGRLRLSVIADQLTGRHAIPNGHGDGSNHATRRE